LNKCCVDFSLVLLVTMRLCAFSHLFRLKNILFKTIVADISCAEIDIRLVVIGNAQKENRTEFE